MADDAAKAARSQLFRQLKPCCVSISQRVLNPPSSPASFREVSGLLDGLLAILAQDLQGQSSALDEKIADYIFFPLSYIFRHQDKYPPPLLERALKCLAILIGHGWGRKGLPALVQQLLLLLGYIIGGAPGSESKHELPEETTLEALKALIAVFKVTASSPESATALVAPATLPQLGHTVTLLLEVAADGTSSEVQLEALSTLECLFEAIKDRETLANFLPGTVSSLVKLLASPAKQKTGVITAALSKLQIILTRVLGDMLTQLIVARAEKTKAEGSKDGTLTPEWLKATAGQIRIALGTVLKLRTHRSGDVQKALERFCVTLLDECHSSLANCADMLVETAVMLLSERTLASFNETSIEDLARIYPELTAHIKSAAYKWTTSLPRVLQSGDEANKKQAIRSLINALTLITNLDIESQTLDDHITMSLRDAVSQLVMTGPAGPKVYDEVTMDEVARETTSLVLKDSQAPVYKSIFMEHESQRQTREHMAELIHNLGSPLQRTKMARNLLEYAKQPTGPTHLAAYWLSFKLLQSTLSRDDDLDKYLDFSSAPSSNPLQDPEEIFQDLYSFSIFALDPNTEVAEIDWRYEAVALEVIEFAAARAREAFRPELIDVLFPVCTLLGAEHPQLRHHAIVTLSSVAVHCGYGSVSELIIENNDYMVNAVSLLLNSMSITPAAVKVLVMVVRLSGPGIVPYLDDVVAAIFAALDSYHGYPAFVDALFSVLNEVVEQGVKSNTLLLEGTESLDHKKRVPPQPTMEEVFRELKERIEKDRQREEEDRRLDAQVRSGHPTKPWGSPSKKSSRIEELADAEPGEEPGDEPTGDEEEDAGDASQGENPQEGGEEEKKPKPPTYTMLKRIAQLTQHYLTAPTPTLRKKLLDLMGVVSPSLSTDPDVFLPLVNEVWPVLSRRLYDPEPFVSVAACEALGALCRGAGDFLSSRFKTEWGDGLGRWCRRAKEGAEKAQGGKKKRGLAPITATAAGEDIIIPIRGGQRQIQKPSSDLERAGPGGGMGRHAQAVKVWEAVVELLVAILSYVRIDDDMFYEFLDLLEELLPSRGDVREALEGVNGDAVWLAMYDRGEVEWMPAPVVEGETFVEMEKGWKADVTV